MTQEEFLTEMQDVLQTDNILTFETILESLEEWDSLAVMSTMAFLDSTFGIKTNMADYGSMKTIGDIAVKAGI